jgi:DNA topoisomerase-1
MKIVKRSLSFEASTIAKDSIEAARAASLRYVSDDGPGFRRRRSGRGFAYYSADGKVVRDQLILARIRSLVIPPAWTDVWICPIENGHLQATGRDARGRKQYRYHVRWTEIRDSAKYDRLAVFAAALPKIRRRVASDLALPGIPKAKVLAAVVQLLETTLIRVGNEEYARTNGSIGLTTMRDRHARVRPGAVEFRFRGKSGIVHEVQVNDRRLARIVKRCQDLPGQELFQYLDDEGQPQPIDSSDVNAYLREASGEDFTAKDFRTWAGTLLAAELLCRIDRPTKKAMVEVIRQVATRLGNTVSVCRKCYIHPHVFDAWIDGALLAAMKKSSNRRASLGRAERALLRLLEARTSTGRRRSSA